MFLGRVWFWVKGFFEVEVEFEGVDGWRLLSIVFLVEGGFEIEWYIFLLIISLNGLKGIEEYVDCF